MAARVQGLGPDLLLHAPAAEAGVGGFLLGAPEALADGDVVEGVGELGGVGFENVGVEEGRGGGCCCCNLVFLVFFGAFLRVGGVGGVVVGVVLDHSGGDEGFVVGLGVA